jgi:hypothetical protein
LRRIWRPLVCRARCCCECMQARPVGTTPIVARHEVPATAVWTFAKSHFGKFLPQRGRRTQPRVSTRFQPWECKINGSPCRGERSEQLIRMTIRPCFRVVSTFVCCPFRARRLGAIPRVETRLKPWASMKPPTLSRPVGRLFLLFLIYFGRHLTTPHLFGFGV